MAQSGRRGFESCSIELRPMVVDSSCGVIIGFFVNLTAASQYCRSSLTSSVNTRKTERDNGMPVSVSEYLYLSRAEEPKISGMGDKTFCFGTNNRQVLGVVDHTNLMDVGDCRKSLPLHILDSASSSSSYKTTLETGIVKERKRN